MIIFKRQYIVVMIEVYFTLLNFVAYTQANNNLLSVNREKRSGSKSIFKDQIFKRIEVLKCTITMSTIKSTSKLKYEHKCIYFLIPQSKIKKCQLIFKWILILTAFSINRTKVECAGLCLAMKNCNSFYWQEAYTSCQILAKGDLCMLNMDSVVIYTKIDDLPPSCPSTLLSKIPFWMT